MVQIKFTKPDILFAIKDKEFTYSVQGENNEEIKEKYDNVIKQLQNKSKFIVVTDRFERTFCFNTDFIVLIELRLVKDEN